MLNRLWIGVNLRSQTRGTLCYRLDSGSGSTHSRGALIRFPGWCRNAIKRTLVPPFARVFEVSVDGTFYKVCYDNQSITYRPLTAQLRLSEAETDGACEQLYRDLTAKGVEVLYHDLDERPGAKFATADLIGIPYQVLVGPRGLAEGKVEIKKRADGTRENISPAAALDLLTR